MKLDDQELNYIAGMMNRALDGGMAITVCEADPEGDSTFDSTVVLERSRDRLAILTAVEDLESPIFEFQNNIGGNWIGNYWIGGMYRDVNGKFTSDWAYDDSGLTGGERRMNEVIGERV